MAISLKNERTVDAVKRLAAHYGVGYTAAIEMAVEAALRAPHRSAQDQAQEQVRRIAIEILGLSRGRVSQLTAS